MAAQMNGRPVDSAKAGSQPGDRLNGRPNGHIPYQRNSPKAPSKSFSRRVLGLLAWLAVWYTILTALFRCPSSPTDVTTDSPRLCGPYLTTRSYIAPYTKPYYDQYAEPYLSLARPYAQKFEQKIYTPAITLGKQNYDQHGAPRIRQASDYGQLQWDKTVKPVIDRTQARTATQYNAILAPHVDKAWSFGESYYITGRKTALGIYNTQLLPAYTTSRPYVEKTYSGARDFAVKTGLPYAQSAWDSILVLLHRNVWPQLRVLYGENIEPQLVRIGERLGRYRDGRKLKAAVEDIAVSPDSSSFSSTASSMSSSVVSAVTSESTDTSTTTTSQHSTSESPVPGKEDEETRQKIANDLKIWQEKFARAADKGTEDLEQRVREITDRQIEKQVKGVGEALVIQLEEAADFEIKKLKKSIIKLVRALPEEPTTKQYSKAEEELSTATKKAGANIRDKAQSMRQWREKFDGETQSLVSAASESTLEVIDNIRDLGLQEIGMRWAWMEGVTYKDWSKYHSVKKTFDEWRKEVEVVTTDHDGLRKASDAAADIESRGMAIAEDSAKELRRLKEVGIWKLQSADGSDNFSTKYVPPKAAKQGQKVMEQASTVGEQAYDGAAEAASSASSVIVGTEAGYLEQASSLLAEASGQPDADSVFAAAKDNAGQVSEQASEAFIVTNTPVHESVMSEASTSASSVASEASKKVYGGAMAQAVKEQKPILDDLVDEDATYSEQMQGMVDQAGERYADVTRAVSEALFQATKTQGTAESVTSVASEQYSKALEAASSALYGTQQGSAESVTSVAAAKYSEAVAAASAVILGTPEPVIASIAAQASLAYAEASKSAYEQYVQAKSAASAQISGQPKPAREAAFSSIESAYAGSVQAASDKMASLINAASTAAHGTSMSPQQSALSAANAKYSEAMAAASSQLESAKSAMGKTSTAGYELFLSEANQRYSSLVDAADASRASATRAASEAYHGPSQGVLESISAVASSKLADSLSAASAHYSNVKAQVGATPTPVHQQYLQEGQQRYYQAVGLAHERYSDFLAAASGAVYGGPTPTLYNAATESLFGTSVPVYQGVIEGAQAQYSAAVAKASENFNAMLESASSAVGKSSKSPVQSILDAASSSYSEALAAASASVFSMSASVSSMSAAASTGIYGRQAGYGESVVSAASDKASSITAAVDSQIAGETPWSESVASQASQNWEALVSKASEQVYGAPTPWSESVRSQAGEYGAQATNGALAQYEAVQALFKEMVSGKQPDFTESVMNRLSAAYYTGAHASAAASASRYISDTYASASSVVSTAFTPPASLEAILQAASDQVNAVVDAANQQYYGSSKGNYEQAISAAAQSYSAASAKASEAVYGTQAGIAEQIQSSLEQVATSAQNAISQAIYGSTAATDSATTVANDAYKSVSSAVQENMASATSAMQAAQAKVSEAIYGPEKGAVESASLRLQGVIESAKARLAALPKDAQAGVEAAQSGIEDAASSVGSMTSKATDRVKDEL